MIESRWKLYLVRMCVEGGSDEEMMKEKECYMSEGMGSLEKVENSDRRDQVEI